MLYKKRYTFNSIDQDIAPDKRTDNSHYNIVNMEAFLTSRSGSIKAAKGPLEIPSGEAFNSVFIIGDTTVEEDLYIWVTPNYGGSIVDKPIGVSDDAIYKVTITDELTEVKLIHTGDWGLSTLFPIQALGIQETTALRKLYWVDANNQARYLGIDANDAILNTDVDYVRANPTPGLLTALEYGIPAVVEGKARYGFTLYDTSQSESKLSPLTDPINIGPNFSSAKVTLTVANPTYENYRIYRVLWETLDDAPTYTLIKEGTLPVTGTVSLIDTGLLHILTLSVEEYFDLGSDYIIPGSLTSKKQRLFFGNYKSEAFKLPVGTDMRAFQYGTDALELGPAEAIPAGFDLQFIYSSGVLEAVSDSEVEYPVTLVEGLKEQQTIIADFTPDDTITFRIATYQQFVVDIYDGTVSVANWRGQVLVSWGETVTINVDNLTTHIYALVVNLPVGALFTTASAYIGYDVVLGVKILIDPATFPNIDNYAYTGVTGIDPPSSSEFSETLLLWSAFTDVSTITDLGGTFELLYLFPNGLIIDGAAVAPGTTVYPRILLNPTGTRQPILGSGLTLTDTVGIELTDYVSPSAVPLAIDAVNPDPLVYKYLSDGVTLGAEGVFVKLLISPVEIYQGDSGVTLPIFKSTEIYRVGIVCQDVYGRNTYVHWVCDLRIPNIGPGIVGSTGHLSTDGLVATYHTIKATLKTAPEGVVSYKFVYVKRELQDKSSFSQGVINPLMDFSIGLFTTIYDGTFPFPNMKEVNGLGREGIIPTDATYFDISVGSSCDSSGGASITGCDIGGGDFYSTISTLTLTDKTKCQIFTPDTLLNKHDVPGTTLRALGTQEIDHVQDATRLGYWDPTATYSKEQSIHGIIFNAYTFLGSTVNPPKYMFGGTPAAEQTDHYSMFMFSRGTRRYIPIDSGLQTEFSLKDTKYLGIDKTILMSGTLIENNIDKIDFAKIDGHSPTNYSAEYVDSYVVEVDEGATPEQWSDYPGQVQAKPYGLFVPQEWADTPTVTDRGFPIVELLQDVPEQYGGNSFDAKSLNVYIDASAGSTTFGEGVEDYTTLVGDTYVGEFAIPHTTGARNYGTGRSCSVYDFVYVCLESEVAVYAANKATKEQLRTLAFGTNSAKFVEVANTISNVDVYSQLLNQNLYPALRFNSPDVFEFTTRITASTVKIAGEFVDSWTKINTATYLDLDSLFGPISKLVRMGDSVVAFQYRGIATIEILPNTQTSTKSGSIQLGKGSVLDDYAYVTTENGSENFQCITVYGSDIYFIDTVNKSLMSIKNGELSALLGFNSTAKSLISSGVSEYLVNNPAGGFVIANDALKQVLFKFSDSFNTLVYSPVGKVFTNSRTYDAYYFLRYYDNVLTANSKARKLYINDRGSIGDYYGVHQDAEIHMVLEPYPGTDKVFDAVQVLKEGVSNFTEIEVTSPTRTSGIKATNFKSKFDRHTTHLPRVASSRDRFRERYIELRLIYADLTELEVDEIFIKFSLKKP